MNKNIDILDNWVFENLKGAAWAFKMNTRFVFVHFSSEGLYYQMTHNDSVIAEFLVVEGEYEPKVYWLIDGSMNDKILITDKNIYDLIEKYLFPKSHTTELEKLVHIEYKDANIDVYQALQKFIDYINEYTESKCTVSIINGDYHIKVNDFLLFTFEDNEQCKIYVYSPDGQIDCWAHVDSLNIFDSLNRCLKINKDVLDKIHKWNFLTH